MIRTVVALVVALVTATVATACGSSSTFTTGYKTSERERVLPAIAEIAKTRGYRVYDGETHVTVHIGDDGGHLDYTALEGEKDITVRVAVGLDHPNPAKRKQELEAIHKSMMAELNP